jgi:hypothetical protein
MKLTATSGKYVLLFLVAFVFSAPHIQKQFSLFESKPLFGYVPPITKDSITTNGWLSATFQESVDKNFNLSFGFRNNLVRLYNECLFRIFNKSGSSYLVVGKKDVLFEDWYINAYTGQDFLGSSSIYRNLQKLKAIQDTLGRMGKTVITIYAPGKASFFSENIPDNYLSYAKDSNNIESYLRFSKELGLNHIDFRTYFNSQKGKHPHPLYAKNGTHWSYYGMCLAADSLIKKIETSRQIDMPNAYWDKIDISEEREYDYDIALTMNLMSTIKGNKMGYPNIKFEKDSTLTKPKTIVIADSYYYGMFNFNIAESFQNNSYWYYNSQVFPDSYEKTVLVKDLDLKSEINNTDVILIMCTEGNLSKFSWGFIDRCYSTYVRDN